MNQQNNSKRIRVKLKRPNVGKHELRTVLASLRQLLYTKPFRISPPAWPVEFSEVIGRLAEESCESNGQADKTPYKGASGLKGRNDLCRLIADIATGLWRAKKKMIPEGATEPPEGLRSSYRHIESAWDALSGHNVEIREHTGERYVAGTALKVIAFQPSPGVQCEMIAETIKPSVFFENELIQRGEVVIATPEEPSTKDKASEYRDKTQTPSSGSARQERPE